MRFYKNYLLFVFNLCALTAAPTQTLFAGQTLSPGNIYPSHLESQCGNENSQGISWEYCISKSRESQNPDVIYYFHGINGSAQDGVSLHQSLKKIWDQEKKSAPTLVGISFGSAYLLASKFGSKETGELMDTFLGNIMPQIEAKLDGLKGRRILLGTSMGGFNASELFLWSPKKFDRVALLCPAMSDISPFVSDEEFEAYLQNKDISREKAVFAREMSQAVFQNESNWNAISPIVQGALQFNQSYPPLFISIGRQDDYGFFSGAKALADLAQSHGVLVQWVPVEGKHCAYDEELLAGFLVSSGR